MPKIALTYFDSAGRAEPVRVALHIAGIPFEDRRLPYAEYGRLRAEGAFPLNAVPLIEVDGVVMTQTTAMLRYVARLGATKLYPSDPMAGFIVDSAMETVNDTLSHALAPSFRERDMEKKLAMRAELVAGPMRLCLAYLEGLLEQTGGPFFGGVTLTIADLVVGQQLEQVLAGGLDGVTEAVLEPTPRLRELVDAYRQHPSIIAYRAR
ncbi:MAG: glutathione S-transferase family protein [Myxococcales bacterium]|nr:glutathione S-transferase family protein [Myxococcales bacterium]MCB9737200.1 glutathione S-transferase family protein [Deltaproteobacteria bacterium]